MLVMLAMEQSVLFSSCFFLPLCSVLGSLFYTIQMGSAINLCACNRMFIVSRCVCVCVCVSMLQCTHIIEMLCRFHNVGCPLILIILHPALAKELSAGHG